MSITRFGDITHFTSDMAEFGGPACLHKYHMQGHIQLSEVWNNTQQIFVPLLFCDCFLLQPFPICTSYASLLNSNGMHLHFHKVGLHCLMSHICV